MRLVFVLVIYFLLFVMFGHFAEAQTIPPQYRIPQIPPHYQHPKDLPLHEKFYSTWMKPYNREQSCCNMHDCYPVEARQLGGQWFAKQRETGNWILVPPQAIETERDNPDGQNHVCMQSSVINPTVYCFIQGWGN